jgi:hypothetical protein
MSTARNRFGVSILVALVLGVLLNPVPADAAARGVHSAGLGTELGLGGIDQLAAMTSTRTQMALGLGAGVPLLVIGFMVRRRIYADV